ncbi:Uncharacterised protein [Shewanella morhuae]|uniref:Uncharacterized protein n=1 Tax=Shewanella morhuae TaxID=365591 RepID=A0A380A2G9_9GAMM|nr:Uncharacterised protein [Shewanella morhuae]
MAFTHRHGEYKPKVSELMNESHGELAVKQGYCSSPFGCSTSPSDVKGFTNAEMVWMPKSGHEVDGRLTNRYGSSFEY